MDEQKSFPKAERLMTTPDDREMKTMKKKKKKSTKKVKRIPKPGVVYISRVPPYMQLSHIKTLLSQHGVVLRIYGQEEQKYLKERRRIKGKDRRIKYVKAWAEFSRKKIARQVADNLNNTMMGGKKRSKYAADLWNIKYLSKFKWHHLTERLTAEKATRNVRIRESLGQQKRENEFILEKVGYSEVLQRKKQKKEGQEIGKKRKTPSGGKAKKVWEPRVFRQNLAVQSDYQ
jgi:ESF2/ABP1 family protein